MSRRSRGFTLIEIMLVIAIIGILLTLLLPNMIRAKYQGHLSSCQNNLRNLAVALENYRTDQNGLYPITLEVAFTQRYISQNPTCVSNGTEYGYVKSSDDQTYTTLCNGVHYVVLPEVIGASHYPQYTPTAGLLLKP